MAEELLQPLAIALQVSRIGLHVKLSTEGLHLAGDL
jgi:hypothetical protein